jgi:hypothetical protein
MRVFRTLLLILAVVLTSRVAPANDACMTQAPIVLADVKYAEVVVLGRIANYEVVGDPGYLDAYARFDILVDEVLLGKAPQKLTVTWDNSTYGEPESMESGPFLIALRDPRSRTLPLRGPSATILPNPEASLLTLLQAPCAQPFMFPSTSNEAREIQEILQQ